MLCIIRYTLYHLKDNNQHSPAEYIKYLGQEQLIVDSIKIIIN